MQLTLDASPQIESLNKVIAFLENDLKTYRAKVLKQNIMLIDVKQKQIDELKAVIHALKVHEIDSQENAKIVDEALFVREACAFYYGVSHFEIKMFVTKKPAYIHQLIDDCLKQKKRQVPIGFLDYIDHEKVLKPREPKPEVKTETKPVFKLEELLKLKIAPLYDRLS